jgi:hypothetical protein
MLNSTASLSLGAKFNISSVCFREILKWILSTSNNFIRSAYSHISRKFTILFLNYLVRYYRSKLYSVIYLKPGQQGISKQVYVSCKETFSYNAYVKVECGGILCEVVCLLLNFLQCGEIRQELMTDRLLSVVLFHECRVNTRCIAANK